MAVAAVAAAVDHAVAGVSRNLKCSGLVFVQRPEMILLIEVGIAALYFVFSELFVTGFKKASVLLRGHAGVQFTAGGDIAGKGEDVHACFHDRVDDAGYFHIVLLGDGGHDHTADTCPVNAADLFQRTVEAAGLAEPVVCLPKAVQRKLILLAAEKLQLTADLII